MVTNHQLIWRCFHTFLQLFVCSCTCAGPNQTHTCAGINLQIKGPNLNPRVSPLSAEYLVAKRKETVVSEKWNTFLNLILWKTTWILIFIHRIVCSILTDFKCSLLPPVNAWSTASSNAITSLSCGMFVYNGEKS